MYPAQHAWSYKAELLWCARLLLEAEELGCNRGQDFTEDWDVFQYSDG